MNVYQFELRSLRKSIITWCAILAFTYYFLVTGTYPMFTDGMKVVMEMIAAMPPEYLLVFGLDVNHMVGYEAFYSFAYIYIALIAVLMTTSVTVNVFGREKLSHCQEFLFAKPVKRNKLFQSKLLAVLTAVLCFNALATSISLFCFWKYGTLDKTAVLATLSITFSQLLFVGIVTFIAVFIPKIRTTTTITATVGLLAYTLEVFINALQIRWLEFFSPLHFFSPKSVFESGSYDLTLVLFAVVISLVSVGVSAMRYAKADLTRL